MRRLHTASLLELNADHPYNFSCVCGIAVIAFALLYANDTNHIKQVYNKFSDFKIHHILFCKQKLANINKSNLVL